jgi:hypothetical protein
VPSAHGYDQSLSATLPALALKSELHFCKSKEGLGSRNLH